MNNYLSDVKKDGTVIIGDKICCDGFDSDRDIRIQSHIHVDHMNKFNTSKSNQIILMSHPTKDLLITEQNADIPFRNNIISIDYFSPYYIDDIIIELAPSDHMLGSVQTKVTFSDKYRVVYSSDFFWPINLGAFECDELIIDATASIKKKIYLSRTELLNILLKRIKEKISEKPIIIQGRRGNIEQTIELIGNEISDIPIITSTKIHQFLKVFIKYGYDIRNTLIINEQKAINIIKKNQLYIGFFDLYETHKIPRVNAYKINLSTHLCYEEPVLDYNENHCKIALTNHADFYGTIKYIKATKCKKVIVDSSRGGNAIELTYHIKELLGIEACPATLYQSKEWGR